MDILDILIARALSTGASPEQIASAVQAYLEDNPLDASDVGALPDSTVIPVVPQMATEPDMSDWTSGKTVDAATLKDDLEVTLASMDNLETNKADKTEIPTKTSDLTNDSGFQTAAQVQTYVAQQIAAIPDELPSGGSTGDFLRKTASGAAWQTVPSAESNSFGGGS